MMNRWAIWIDIEGFSKRYPEDMARALLPLRELMRAIHACGSTLCRESPKRIFAHQIGDGFIIVAEFAEDCPELPIAISIYLLRRVLLAGGAAKAAVSEGTFEDIQDCYPKELMDCESDGYIPMGDSFISLFRVMGTALINAHSLASVERGAVLLVDQSIADSEAIQFSIVKSCSNPGFRYSLVDWVGSTTDRLRQLEEESGWRSPTPKIIAANLLRYRSTSPGPPEEWTRSTKQLSGFQKWVA